MLYGLGALSLPILIHLWQRRRVIEVPIGTLRFLKAIAARTSRSSKLENILLLLLRCLLFALVIFAAARPVMLAKTAHFLGGDIPRTIVLIIDNSMSMGYIGGGQARLESAKASARALLDDLKQGDRVAVIAAASSARLLVAEPTIDRAIARKAVDGIQLTQDRSNFESALREANKIAARTERGIRQIFFFTDSQESGWRTTLANRSSVFDTAWQQAGAQFIVVRPDDLQAINACVKQVRIDSPFVAPGATVRGMANVENFSTAALHDVLNISMGSERVAQKPADVPPNGTVEVPFEFVVPAVPGRWARGSVSLSGDDAFFFAIPVYQPPRAVVAEGAAAGPERLRAGYYLRKALAVGMENPIQTRSIAANQLEDTPIENQTVVFLADPGRLGDRSVARLERFLEGGGTVVLFPGDQSGLKDFDNLGFLPAKPTILRNLAAGRQPVRITTPTHPLFADAWDTGTPFPALPQQRLLEWKLAVNALPLLTIGSATNSSTALPFLIYGERGPGRTLIVNASADRTWGDFPLSPAFVPLVQQIARFSAAQGGRSEPIMVGDPLPLPPTLPRDKTISLTLPDASHRSLPPHSGTRAILMDHTDLQGFYEAAAGDESVLLPVNIDRAESNLNPLAIGALEKLSPKTEFAHLVGTEELRQWLSQSKGMAPIWPGLLIAALAIFAIEGILSNLVAGRRSQGGEKKIVTGRLNRRRMGAASRAGGTFFGASPEPQGEKKS